MTAPKYTPRSINRLAPSNLLWERVVCGGQWRTIKEDAARHEVSNSLVSRQRKAFVDLTARGYRVEALKERGWSRCQRLWLSNQHPTAPAPTAPASTTSKITEQPTMVRLSGLGGGHAIEIPWEKLMIDFYGHDRRKWERLTAHRLKDIFRCTVTVMTISEEVAG